MTTEYVLLVHDSLIIPQAFSSKQHSTIVQKWPEYFLQCQKVVFKFKISICNFTSCIMRCFWYEQVKIHNISFARLVSVVVLNQQSSKNVMFIWQMG